MQNTVEILIPRVMAWLLRVYNAPGARWKVANDPVLFAQWYAMATDLIKWPDAVTLIQEQERRKKISLERMSSLMTKLGFQNNSFSASKTKDLLEGYAVHEWINSNWDTFEKIVSEASLRYQPLWEEVPYTTYGKNVEMLSKSLNLNSTQNQVLEFAFICGVSTDLSNFIFELSKRFKGSQDMWTTLFDCKEEELRQVIDPKGPLMRCGLLEPHQHTGLVQVNNYWVELLVKPVNTIKDLLVKPLLPIKSAGRFAVLAAEDKDLAIKILKGSNVYTKGINFLMYGASGLDKSKVLDSLVSESGRHGWTVDMEKIPHHARRTTVYLALSELANSTGQILIVERAGDVLERKSSMFLKMLFGLEIEREEHSEQDAVFFEFTTPSIWVSSDVESLSTDTVGRFIFHAALKKADRHQRHEQMLEILEKSKLSKEAQNDIAKLDGISSLQIESALRAAKLAGLVRGKTRDQAVVQAIKRSQRALGRDLTERFKPSVTHYSTDLLNCTGRFGPEQILAALQRNKRGTMAFYGPPGTGKTQFAEYIASQLGVPLIAKRASDLMGKYVGDNEKNIAAMFEEATTEDAMLLLDEGDSFLRDRSYARSSWEVTMVNELLQHMERFPGIFVVCTNLFEGLDSAALRRFTFKLEFNALTMEQRWKMFVKEAGLSDIIKTVDDVTREVWYERLALMQQLAAGDFATVKRQANILDVTLTPEDWLTQLEQEVRVKRKRPSEPMMD